MLLRGKDRKEDAFLLVDGEFDIIVDLVEVMSAYGQKRMQRFDVVDVDDAVDTWYGAAVLDIADERGNSGWVLLDASFYALQ